MKAHIYVENGVWRCRWVLFDSVLLGAGRNPFSAYASVLNSADLMFPGWWSGS